MRRYALPLALSTLLLAACSTTEQTVEPSPAPSVEATTEADAVTVEATTEPTAECEAGAAETPLAEAITAASLPDGATVQMVQELEDIDSGLLDVIVYLCTPPLDDEQHRTIATDLAIAAHGTGEGIDEMIVGQYTPEGEQGPSLEVEEFGLYTWDRDAARAPESIWES